MHNVAGNAGIKDIAKALKVSIGTVDRALHGRPGVSAKTKARVLQMAKRLGYKPNLAAQALKLNRRVSIGVVLPETHLAFLRSAARRHSRCCRCDRGYDGEP